MIENLGHSNDGYCFVDPTLTTYKVALLWTILHTNCHDTLTKTLTQNSSIDSRLFRRVNCQEPSSVKYEGPDEDRTLGCVPFTKTIRLEISGINMKQLNARLRERELLLNVSTSARETSKRRKIASPHITAHIF